MEVISKLLNSAPNGYRLEGHFAKSAPKEGDLRGWHSRLVESE